MGVRFLIDDDDSCPTGALYDSVTGTAFGPLFEGERHSTRADVWEWMERACRALPCDARAATYSQIREARDATIHVEQEAEIGGEG